MSPRSTLKNSWALMSTFLVPNPCKNVISSGMGDHPELVMSKELDAEGIKNYQSLTGALQ